MGKTGRIAGACLLTFFACEKVALSQAPNQELSPPRPLQVSELFVSPELGQVSQIHEVPASDHSTKQLIVIQDAHVNFSAQKHLAQILDQLVSTYGIRLILV